MKDTITEGNTLIAQFMGYSKPSEEWLDNYHGVSFRRPGWRPKDTSLSPVLIKDDWILYPDTMMYDNSWNDLMPAVEKIESIHDSFHGYFGVYIRSNGCAIQGTNLRTDPDNPHYAYYSDIIGDTKLKATWEAVVWFIKWYNEELAPKVDRTTKEKKGKV